MQHVTPLKQNNKEKLSPNIHGYTNSERGFILSRDKRSMAVHSRSGEWPLWFRRAILVPADDRVSSSDAPGGLLWVSSVEDAG